MGGRGAGGTTRYTGRSPAADDQDRCVARVALSIRLGHVSRHEARVDELGDSYLVASEVGNDSLSKVRVSTSRNNASAATPWGMAAGDDGDVWADRVHRGNSIE